MGSVSPTPAASMPGASKPGGEARRPTRSRGIELPDLVGRPAAGSVAELRKLGLKPNSVPEPVNDAAQAGLVIAQDPPAGEFVPANTRVRIEIGDHSLFDPRKYESSSRAAPEARELIPPIPSPLELLSYGPPNAWVSDEPLETNVSEAPPGHQPAEDGLWSRWPEFDGAQDLDPAEDPFAGEEHPRDEPHTSRVPADPRDSSVGTHTYASEPRWTNKQRKRVLLSLGLLLLLACLTVTTHFGAATRPVPRSKGAAQSSLLRTLVVTVTVTAPSPVTTRGDGS
jgi:hypothetical protein